MGESGNTEKTGMNLYKVTMDLNEVRMVNGDWADTESGTLRIWKVIPKFGQPESALVAAWGVGVWKELRKELMKDERVKEQLNEVAG